LIKFTNNPEVKIDIELLPVFIKNLRMHYSLLKLKKLDDWNSFAKYFNEEAHLNLNKKYNYNWQAWKSNIKAKNKKLFKEIN
jgi:hypothetical protein